MGGATNRSLISAYFLTAETYKRMRLTTRVYGIQLMHANDVKKINLKYVNTTYAFQEIMYIHK